MLSGLISGAILALIFYGIKKAVKQIDESYWEKHKKPIEWGKVRLAFVGLIIAALVIAYIVKIILNN